jgi:hypothetical protein
MGHTVETGLERIRNHLRRPHPHTMNTTDQTRSTVFLIDPQLRSSRNAGLKFDSAVLVLQETGAASRRSAPSAAMSVSVEGEAMWPLTVISPLQ